MCQNIYLLVSHSPIFRGVINKYLLLHLLNNTTAEFGSSQSGIPDFRLQRQGGITRSTVLPMKNERRVHTLTSNDDNGGAQ